MNSFAVISLYTLIFESKQAGATEMYLFLVVSDGDFLVPAAIPSPFNPTELFF